MSVNLNVSDFSADLFALDRENKPANAGQFLKGLNLLALQALGALSKPEDVELAFQLIKNVSLVELGPQDKIDVAQRIQDVFNTWVKVSFGDLSRYVPRERLAKQCGPKFKAQYTSQMIEATARELDLKSADAGEWPTDGCPEDCKVPILVYLQTGVLPPRALGENALNMLLLAEQHQLEELTQECLDFLIDNLSIENQDTFFEFTQQTNFPRLEVACLNFMKDNRDSISGDLKTKHQEQLSIVEALAEGKITLKLSLSGIFEAQVETITGQTADSLQKINKKFAITSLIILKRNRNNLFDCLKQIAPTLNNLQELIFYDLTTEDSNLRELKFLFPNLKALGNGAPFLNTFVKVKAYLENFRKTGEEDQESKKPLLRSLNLLYLRNLTDDQLDELTPYLQELYYLTIGSDKITSVVAPKATSVNCGNCKALTTLDAPKATSVSCWGCERLTTLDAPKATKVTCWGCERLTTLKAPEASDIYCSQCPKLTALEAPKATMVDCRGCRLLTTLKAPETTEVKCSGCTTLTTLKAPEATFVDCSDCTLLTTLEAPEATVVFCYGCAALTTLEVPKATWVICEGCTLLTTLVLPKATGVNCCSFTKLTTLKAPEATVVYCYNCPQLTTLEVPKATSVNCSDFTQLTTLEAPKATRVNCIDCTQLSNLEAPEATWIRCRGCTALITLEAPKATEVNCSGCTVLITLEAPKATDVNCIDCTQLSTLEVPEAIEVHCSGCNMLTTLEAPEANFVDQTKYILLIRIFINSLWAFLARASQGCLSLFDSLKSYLQNTLRTP